MSRKVEIKVSIEPRSKVLPHTSVLGGFPAMIQLETRKGARWCPRRVLVVVDSRDDGLDPVESPRPRAPEENNGGGLQ